MQRPRHGAAPGSQQPTATTLSGTVAGLSHALPHQGLGDQRQVRHRLSRRQQQTATSGDRLAEDVCTLQPGLEHAGSTGATRTSGAEQTCATTIGTNQDASLCPHTDRANPTTGGDSQGPRTRPKTITDAHTPTANTPPTQQFNRSTIGHTATHCFRFDGLDGSTTHGPSSWAVPSPPTRWRSASPRNRRWLRPTSRLCSPRSAA